MAQDPDGDVLQYRLFCRRLGSDRWLPLAGGLAVPMNQYVWNTDSLPDGFYVLKVVASDEKSNLKPEALTEEIESDALLVDNTKPEVRATASGLKVSGEAVDATSSILRLEVQIDGGAWKTVAAKDGVLDSSKEAFEIDLAPEKLPKGEHTVSVRAYDQEMNVGVTSIAVTAP
jgi:hypothetical protein